MSSLVLQSYNICYLSLWDRNVLTSSAFVEVEVSAVLDGILYVSVS